MDELALLRELFAAIKLNKDYQNELKGSLLRLEYVLKSGQPARQRKSPGKPVKKRKISELHPHFQLQRMVSKYDRETLSAPTKLTPAEVQTVKDLLDPAFPDWSHIGSVLGKCPFEVFRAYNKQVNTQLQLDSKWTEEEEALLREATTLFGTKNWKEVSNYIETKDNKHCYYRWMKTKNPTIRSGKWAEEEDKRLAVGVKIFGNKWTSVAQCVPNRTDVQCRERYCNVLSPAIKNSQWTAFEDTALSLSVVVFGKKWCRIAKFVNTRTDNQCSRRYKYLIKHSKLLQSLTLLAVLPLRDLPECSPRLVHLLRELHTARTIASKFPNS